MAASSGVRPRNSSAVPILQPLASRRFRFSAFIKLGPPCRVARPLSSQRYGTSAVVSPRPQMFPGGFVYTAVRWVTVSSTVIVYSTSESAP